MTIVVIRAYTVQAMMDAVNVRLSSGYRVVRLYLLQEPAWLFFSRTVYVAEVTKVVTPPPVPELPTLHFNFGPVSDQLLPEPPAPPKLVMILGPVSDQVLSMRP